MTFYPSGTRKPFLCFQTMREYKDTESCGSQQIAEAIINHVKLPATTCGKKEKLFPTIQFGFSQVFCHGN